MSLQDQWKYEKAYQLSNYHLQGVRQQEVWRDIETMLDGSSYLDVGCGRGESVIYASQRGITAYGTEIVPELCNEKVFRADIEDLPFDTNSFDYVSCYDVLEHLPPGTEQAALNELGRVCKTWLILTTNDRPSHLPTGEDLHVNKRPRDVWHSDIVLRWGESNVVASTFGHAGRRPEAADWKWVVRIR